LIWWIHQPSRALSEKAEIAALAGRVSWLRVLSWQPPDLTSLSVEIELDIDGKSIPLTLIYPEMFPEFPARIVPTDGVRLSAHQYGASGELCLEWRPDNWRDDITGAVLIESAYRLLSTEREAEELVESAHDLTVGQEVRQRNVRLLLPDDCVKVLLSLPEGSRTPVTTAERNFVKTWVSEVTLVGDAGETLWESAPTAKFGNTVHHGIVFREAVPEGFPDKAAAKAFLGDLLDRWKAEHPTGDPVFIFASDGQVKMYELLEDPPNLASYETILIPALENRLPSDLDALSSKKVGIVGCGSVGSKIAASLARSGVRDFVLVDSDIVFADNIVRNQLDRRSVGVNKTKGVERAILDISPSAAVDISDVLLGRQESGAWSANAAMKLAKCDVIVDATADINAFMTCAAVAQVYKKPLVWGRVYEGGLGGLVARARPDTDPVPQAARRQIDNWFVRNNVPWKSSDETRSYGGSDERKAVVASDAEVSIVAMHLARFAIDALINGDTSTFSSSVYVMGFAVKWMFTQPLDIWPIDLLPEGAWGAPTEADRDKNHTELVAELFPEADEQDAG